MTGSETWVKVRTDDCAAASAARPATVKTVNMLLDVDGMVGLDKVQFGIEC